MPPPSSAVGVIPSPGYIASLALLGVVLYYIGTWLEFLRRPFTSPLRAYRGPSGGSFVFGHMRLIGKSDPGVVHAKWVAEYGPTLTYRGFLSVRRLFTLDSRAITHILANPAEFPKSARSRRNLAGLLGYGLITVDGETHRRQRKIMDPSFTQSHIREMSEVFWLKATEMRDIWLDLASQEGSARIDGFNWLTRATLDIIGLAGFNYEFDSLKNGEEGNELASAFREMFIPGSRGVANVLRGVCPALAFLKNDSIRKAEVARATVERIGRTLVRDKKAAILAASNSITGVQTSKAYQVVVEKSNIIGRDLLSLLIKANMSADLPESQRLTDEEVMGQMPTFILAGHETTSTAATWATFALCNNPAVQARLRAEICSVRAENLSMDELNSLPYLDAVVRETMRLYSPVPITSREVAKNTVIPTNTPFIDKYGVMRHEIRVGKGDEVLIPIRDLNTSKELWGEDALEFKPERWSALPRATKAIPGVMPPLLSFLAGSRSCIGWKFAIIEMKVLLFTVFRSFEIQLAVPEQSVTARSIVVSRPYLKDDLKSGPQLPIIIRPIGGAD